MTLACGLDFGTSNSTIGFAGTQGPQLLPVEGESRTIPSTIFFSFEDGSTHFGRAALGEYVTGGEGRLMRALKSVLGTSLIADTTPIGKRRVPFTEILGIFIGEVKARAETALGAPLDTVVVGRPVQFVDDDAKADAQAQAQLEGAVRAQGFSQIAFQFEPIAAALDYERQVDDEQLALIVDLGGGTSDFSLVRVGPERARASDRQGDILATAGVHIGGTDFDRLLSMARVMPELGLGTMTADGKRNLPVAPYYDLATWHRINRLYTQKTLLDLNGTRKEAAQPARVDKLIAVIEDRQGHRLAGEVEAAKIALSDSPQVGLHFETRGGDIGTQITAQQLSGVLEDAVGRIMAAIDRTLALGGIGPGDVHSLILTGGSTLVPVVVKRLRAAFPGARFVRTDVLGSVGLGLSIDAARKFGTR